jgi:hypothetical protein
MEWDLLLLLLPFAILAYWAGFIATKRMRIGKNKEREELAKRLLAEKAAREANETSAAKSPPEQQETN